MEHQCQFMWTNTKDRKGQIGQCKVCGEKNYDNIDHICYYIYIDEAGTICECQHCHKIMEFRFDLDRWVEIK